ncbi:DUF2927 domain-containing protein [Jannaschia sp. Os4]|uniref:DUF2927 domain-containing protein n=1 Tax=Jannaschia sp. Os4 TaxID=2807617 RepID=UPI00193A7C8A|nr:DUF2927 domain-containing protein [Jannaschia sp. Os4]MBM2574700.1 DUF2927 domain-containing protein [Jannaschia sp. Os4]
MIRALTLAAMVLASCAPIPGPVVSRAAPSAEARPAKMMRFTGPPAPTPAPSNTAFVTDFIDLHFRLESGRAVPRLTRFEGAVPVAVEGRGPATLQADLDDLIARLRAEAGIDIRRARPGEAARMTVSLQPRARLQRRVPGAACFVVPGVSGWRDYVARAGGPGTDWTRIPTRTTASIFLPSDTGPQEARDCLHEEMAQALGPLNDLFRLPHSVFNDDDAHGVLTAWDMLVLRATYDPALRSGMTRAETAAALPAILARLNPGGRGAPAARSGAEPAEWLAAMRRGTAAGGDGAARLRAATRAVSLARGDAVGRHRLATSLMALGRARVGYDADAARAAFLEAETVYRDLHGDGIHAAHAALQVAAFDLSAGAPGAALARIDRALPAARGAQDAKLLATLLLLRSEAAARAGRPGRGARDEGLAWGRYAWVTGGAGSRAREVAALASGV